MATSEQRIRNGHCHKKRKSKGAYHDAAKA
jgi:hypothetical protein